MAIIFRQMSAVSKNIVKEALRTYSLGVFIFIVFLMFLFNYIISDIAIGNDKRVMINLGFFELGILGVVLSIYYSSNLIKKEIQNKTLYIILSRPVSKSVFYAGKFLGVIFVCFLIYLFLSIIWVIQLKLYGIDLGIIYFYTLFFVFLECVLLVSAGTMFASFTSPILNSFFLVSIYFFGHLSKSLLAFANNSENLLMQKILTILYYIIPNLEALNFRDFALYNKDISWIEISLGLSTGLSWVGLFFVGGLFIFNSRKLL
ncbi:MAG: ABC transporter permease [Desulforegulaceae bacterium]|nr:ABC transporter permease [Desulforegulaceae bacterium]